jgi:hypothetical protein
VLGEQPLGDVQHERRGRAPPPPPGDNSRSYIDPIISSLPCVRGRPRTTHGPACADPTMRAGDLQPARPTGAAGERHVARCRAVERRRPLGRDGVPSSSGAMTTPTCQHTRSGCSS